MSDTIYVETSGNGPPLVLLHGFALHGGLFAPLVPSLALRFRVHVVDLPGHGRSAPVPSFSLDAIAAALDDRFAEAEPLRLLGWSLGGMVALAWARARPSRIARLVLVATTPRFTADASWPHAMSPVTLARFADELRASYRLTLQRFVTLQVQGSEHGKATLAALRHALAARGQPSAAVLGEALATLAQADVRAALPSIATPALVIAGERDTLVPAEASRTLARTLPDARYVEIAGAAHAPFLSHPDAFLSAALPFLDG